MRIAPDPARARQRGLSRRAPRRRANPPIGTSPITGRRLGGETRRGLSAASVGHCGVALRRRVCLWDSVTDFDGGSDWRGAQWVATSEVDTSRLGPIFLTAGFALFGAISVYVGEQG